MNVAKQTLGAVTAMSLAVAVNITRGTSPLCDLSGYHASAGVTASIVGDALAVSWSGQDGAELRARYGVNAGQPVVRDLSIRKAGAEWRVLAHDLTPEYRVTSGVRRMSEQQAQPLRDAGVELTQAVIDQNRWYAFWDAPLLMPDAPELRRAGQSTAAAPRVLGPPRSPAEIRRATASFNAASCAVVSDGATVAVAFQGLSMGIFSGSLRFTSYRGANLLRMDAIALRHAPTRGMARSLVSSCPDRAKSDDSAHRSHEREQDFSAHT